MLSAMWLLQLCIIIVMTVSLHCEMLLVCKRIHVQLPLTPHFMQPLTEVHDSILAVISPKFILAAAAARPFAEDVLLDVFL